MKLSSDEFVAMTADLQSHHAVFYQMWEFGKISFTDRVPTAAVTFDSDGECIEFMFNPDFWKKLNIYQRKFVICHECAHAILKHGLRIRDTKNPMAANVALDVVVNHILLDKFKFTRQELGDLANDLCWLDTVFPKDNEIEPEKSFEYYYKHLMKNVKELESLVKKVLDDHNIMGGVGQKGDGSGDEDEAENGKIPDWDKLIDQLNESLEPEEKESLKDVINKHFQKDKEGKQGDQPGGRLAGKGTGGQWVFTKIEKVKRKKKWETVIKKWSKRFDKADFRDVEQWARMNRRFAAIGGDLMLPTEMELEYHEEGKILVYFFQDTSGSCWGLKDRFFKAARSLSPERFDIRMFCFDTQVKEINIAEGKIYGGGGTSFRIIEEHIQKVMKEENSRYPESVFVITDGYGDFVTPAEPKKWYWFMSHNYRYCIPKESNMFMLNDFE